MKELELNRCEGDAQDLLEGVHEKLNVLALGGETCYYYNSSFIPPQVAKNLMLL